MPQKNASSARFYVAVGGLLAVIALIVWAVTRSGAVAVPQVADGGVRSSAPVVRRAPAPLERVARPRAGVSGHVVDPEQHGVAGATVCSWPSSHGGPAVQLGLTTPQLMVPRCAQTDASGAYALSDLFPVTDLTLSATAEGFPPQAYRPESGEFRLGEGEQRDGVDFVLHAGGVKIKGRVDDVTGGLVAGAIVATGGQFGRDEPARAMVTSDSKGEFSLWVDPGMVHLTATATSYAPGRASGVAPGHFFVIHLVPGATLIGHAVVAGTETPVPNAMIEAIQVEGGGLRASARTGDDGRFRIEGLVPGRYRVEATSEGREGYSHASITLGMGETSPDTLVELDPAYVVKGRVVESGTGAPCKAGQVTITDPKQNEFSQASIDPDGWARMASVIPGDYKVEVRCEGHVSHKEYPNVVIANQDAPELSWPVDKGASVRVSVVDEKGKAVPKATVNAYSTDPRGNGTNPGGYTDHAEADGTYLVSGLMPGAYHVSARGEDGSSETKDVEVAATREEKLTIELPTAGVIDGVVLDGDRQPVAGVMVQAAGPGHANARSSEDGTFTMMGLEPGDYTVSAFEPPAMRDGDDLDEGPQARKPQGEKVTVKPPTHAKTTVMVKKRDGRIEGQVVDSKGQPVTDAFIDVSAEAGNRRRGRFGGMSGMNGTPVVTDTEGRFKIDRLAPGTYHLRAFRNGGGEANAEDVKIGSTNVVLKLSEGASLTGMLTSRGAPVERFTMDVMDRKTGFRRDELFFHAGGVFTLRDLPAGTYQVDARTPLGRATAEVTIGEGEQKTGVELTMTLNAILEGRVVDAESGAPVIGMWVSIDGHGGAPVGADGKFRIEEVPGGSRTLHTGGEGSFELLSMPLEVNNDGDLMDVGTLRLAHRVIKPSEPDLHEEQGE